MTEILNISVRPSSTGRTPPRALDDDDLEGQMLLESVHSRLFEETLEPTVVGAHKVIKRLGTGGMGDVYLAMNTELERLEALKVVRSSRVREPKDRRRLIDEGKALARLAHPNVVHVYGGEEERGNFYLAMEYVPGQTAEVWQRGQRSWREVLAVYLDAGRGLHAVHQAGLVHRDFKPSNVILGDEGGARRVRVIDFGLALDDGATRHEAGLGGRPVPSYGTPYFLSPEQCRGQPVTAKSDQFSFCTALYDALYHQHPYYVSTAGPERAATDGAKPQPPTDQRPFESLVAALRSPETPLREPPAGTSVPRRVFNALARGLARDPGRRFPTMAELLAELSGALKPSPAKWWAGGVVAVLLAGAGGYYAATTEKLPGSCQNLEAMVSPVWNQARAGRIRAGFLATGLPYAGATYDSVLGMVTTYVTDWKDTLGAVCNATYQAGALDEASYFRQRQCLERRLGDLDTTLGAFGAADPRAVAHAYATIQSLPPIRDCAQLAANQCAISGLLAAGDGGKIRSSFGRVQKLEGQGRYEEAAGVAGTAMKQAEAFRSPALTAEAAYRRGRLLAETANWPAARIALATAIHSAEAGGCQTLAIDAMNELGRVDGLDTATTASSVDFLAVVTGSLENLQEGGLRLARAYKNRGLGAQRKQIHAADRKQRVEALRRAKQDFLEVLRILESDAGPVKDELSTAYRNLGLVELELGESAAAIEHLEAGQRLAVEAFGAGHPATWRAEFDLGHGHVATGSGVGAVDHLEKALTLVEASYDKESHHIARVHTDLARAYELLYDYRGCLNHALAAEALFERLERPGHEALRFAARRLVAFAFEMLGEHQMALKWLGELAEDSPWVELDPDEEIAITFLELARTHLSLGRLEDATRDLEQASKLLPADHPLRVELDQLQALVWLEQRDSRAVAALRAAEEAARNVTKNRPGDVIERDAWIHLAWGLARATCAPVAPEVTAAIDTLHPTTRLDRLKRAIQVYQSQSASQCTPISPLKP